MRIIFSNFDDMQNPYYGGGGAFAVHEVAKRLAKRNEVTVVTGSYPGSKNEAIDGVAYKRIGAGFGGPRFGQAVYQVLLPFYVMTMQFDSWVESFTPPFSTACLQLFTKKPVIGLVHSLSGKDMRRRYHVPFDVFERWGLRTYKRIIVLTEYMKEYIASVSASTDLFVIPNGVDEEYIHQTVGPKENYIAYIGRLDIEQKGLDLLVAAYGLMKDKATARLRIAGSGSESEIQKLKSTIAKAGVEDRVELVGKVSGKEKWDLLNKSLVLAAPSRGENFALIALEAFCAESALVAFDIPGFSWIPDNCIVKTPTFDVQMFAKNIEELLRDEPRRVKQAQVAKDFVQQFTWDTIAEKYEKVISQ